MKRTKNATDILPTLILPVSLTIAFSPKLPPNASTSLASCIIAPNNVRVRYYPKELNQNEFDENETVLLWPSDDAVYLDELDVTKISHIVVIESS